NGCPIVDQFGGDDPFGSANVTHASGWGSGVQCLQIEVRHSWLPGDRRIYVMRPRKVEHDERPVVSRGDHLRIDGDIRGAGGCNEDVGGADRGLQLREWRGDAVESGGQAGGTFGRTIEHDDVVDASETQGGTGQGAHRSCSDDDYTLAG